MFRWPQPSSIVGALATIILIACATKETVVMSSYDGEVQLTFDTRKIPRERMSEFIRLSPWTTEFLPPPLELCVESDFEYRDCGSRTLEAPNFLYNAEVNLAKGQRMRNSLEQLDPPLQLQPIVKYGLRSVSFYLCLQRAQLSYYRGDDAALSMVCEDIDPDLVCSGSVHAATLARTPVERFRVAGHDWRNCMNSEFRQQLGDYPSEHWQQFLGTFDVEEKIIQ